MISGEAIDSEPIVLKCSQKELFQRGSVESFLITIPQVLRYEIR